MLRAVGVVAEYNPFHNGHAYQLAEARRRAAADVTVVAMSGNFVQRGEPALFDKWTRAQAALQGGADLVVELPLTVSTQPADRFARGGVQALAQLQCGALAFGTERPGLDYAALGRQINALPPHPAGAVDYAQTYATQLNQFYQETLHVGLDDPNVILALGYAAANAALAQPMALVPVPRVGVAHDAAATSQQLASASWLRQHPDQLAAYVPAAAAALYADAAATRWADFWPLLHYRLLTDQPADLRRLYQMTEGLEYRFIEQNWAAAGVADLLKRVKTKRYTYSRLSRVALYTLLHLTNDDMTVAQPLRILGFTPRGQAYLKQIRKAAGAALLTRVNAAAGAFTAPYGLTVRADRVYTLSNGHEQNFGRAPMRITKG